MRVDIFKGFDEFVRNPCHFQDCPDEAVGNRRKGSNEVEEDRSSIRGARDGELVHVCIHHKDVVHHEATSNTFLRMVEPPINNFTQSEFKARASDFNEGVGEVEGAEVKRGVDLETGWCGEEGLLGKEDEEREEELRVEALI